MPETKFQTETEDTAEKLLERALESLRQESGRIQIQAKALTDEEKARLTKIESAVELIDQALGKLGRSE